MSEPTTPETLPGFDDVVDAARVLSGVAKSTPVHRSQHLDSLVGGDVAAKCENFQRVGAFKFRGAYNAVSRLTPEERDRGVLSYSSGNHAQAVALACQILDVSATIVMPNNAPVTKRAATEGYGAKVVEHEPNDEAREEVAARLQAETGAVMIPPFDHPHVIAGQGTAAMELVEEVGDLDYLMVPCGGGGLLSGSALAVRVLSPECQVIGVEPEQADDATRSFRTGTLHTVPNPTTIADGTRTASLGILNFEIIRRDVDDMVTVSEEDIALAVVFLFTRMKLVVEPSGALPVAALLSGALPVEGRIGVILSGGNMDPSTFAALF